MENHPIPTRHTHTLVQESDTINHPYKVGGDQGFNPKHYVSAGEGKIDFQSRRTEEGRAVSSGLGDGCASEEPPDGTCLGTTF